jgi:hypothetical protein
MESVVSLSCSQEPPPVPVLSESNLIPCALNIPHYFIMSSTPTSLKPFIPFRFPDQNFASIRDLAVEIIRSARLIRFHLFTLITNSVGPRLFRVVDSRAAAFLYNRVHNYGRTKGPFPS